MSELDAYTLAHGTAVDFELWMPQSMEFRRQKHRALRDVRSGLLPLLSVPRYSGEVLQPGVEMRAETRVNLSPLFWADAVARERELGHELNYCTVRRRAVGQMKKYLTALSVKMEGGAQ